MITINSLDKVDARLRKKTLEEAAKNPLTHEVFLKLLSEHETWFNQKSKFGAVKKGGSRISGKTVDRTMATSSRENISCFCCQKINIQRKGREEQG